MRYNYLKNFEQIALQSKNNQISGLSQNSDVTTQYSAATLAAASKFKRVLGIVSTIQISTETEMTQTLICPGKGGLRCEAGAGHHQQLSLGHGAEGEQLVLGVLLLSSICGLKSGEYTAKVCEWNEREVRRSGLDLNTFYGDHYSSHYNS